MERDASRMCSCIQPRAHALYCVRVVFEDKLTSVCFTLPCGGGFNVARDDDDRDDRTGKDVFREVSGDSSSSSFSTHLKFIYKMMRPDCVDLHYIFSASSDDYKLFIILIQWFIQIFFIIIYFVFFHFIILRFK